MGGAVRKNIGPRLAEDKDFTFNTLKLVFKYLSVSDLINCAQVCPLWKWVVASEEIWDHHRSIYGCEKHINEAMEYTGGHLRKLMVDMNSLEGLAEACSYGIEKVRKIALTYTYYESLYVLAEYNRNIRQMYIHYMDRFEYPPKVLDNLGYFSKLTHLDLVEFSPYYLLENANFLYLLKKLQHLALWSHCEERVWCDVADQKQLQSLNLYAGDSNCIKVLFEKNYIRKLKRLKKLKINNICFQVTIQLSDVAMDCYDFTIRRVKTDYFALQNNIILKTLSKLGKQLEQFTWIISDSEDGAAFSFAKLMRLNITPDIATSRIPDSENVLVSFAEIENILRLKMPNTKVTVMDVEEMARNTKIPKCVICNKNKYIQYTYFFASFFNSF